MTASAPAPALRIPMPATDNRARRGSLAEQLAALLAYRTRPEGPVEPLKSNWTTVPANDNADPSEVADFGHERRLRVTPSVQEIMRQVATGEVEKNDEGQVIRIGCLRFSDGTQTEQAYRYGPDNKVIQFNCVMPEGAMLGGRENGEAALGGGGYTGSDLTRSNNFFAETLRTSSPRYIKRTERRNGPGMTAAEARADLEKAIANTANMPEVKRFPPGMPCGSRKMADSFVGMQVAATGSSGAILWQDISGAVVQREIWEQSINAMNRENVAVLDKALVAKTLAEISPGGTKRGARKRGKKALQAANDNLSEILKRISA